MLLNRREQLHDRAPQELMAHSDVVPSVNQVEFSPFLSSASCSISAGRTASSSKPIARLRAARSWAIRAARRRRRHGKTPAQVVLRWALQHEVVVIPKSGQPARIDENAALFDFKLEKRDMAALDALYANFRAC